MATTGKMLTMIVGDTTMLSIPNLFKGRLKRLTINNPTVSDVTLTFKDTFTPDVSNGVPSPVEVTRSLSQIMVRNVDSVDLPAQDEKLMDDFYGVATVTSNVADVTVSYVMDLI